VELRALWANLDACRRTEFAAAERPAVGRLVSETVGMDLDR